MLATQSTPAILVLHPGAEVSQPYLLQASATPAGRGRQIPAPRCLMPDTGPCWVQSHHTAELKRPKEQSQVLPLFVAHESRVPGHGQHREQERCCDRKAFLLRNAAGGGLRGPSPLLSSGSAGLCTSQVPWQARELVWPGQAAS